MSYETLYAIRTEIKSALKAIDMTQVEFCHRTKRVPVTFTNKLNGLTAMDAAEEAKILSDIAAMGATV